MLSLMFLTISEMLLILNKSTTTKSTTLKELNVILKTPSELLKSKMLATSSETHKLNSRVVKLKRSELVTNMMSTNNKPSPTKNI